MMKYRSTVLFTTLSLVIILLLSGCMSAVPKEKLNTIKRIGIVSFLGDNIELRQDVLLHQTARSFSVESWKIDKYVQETIKKEIERNSRFTVVNVDYDYKRLNNFIFTYQIYSKKSGLKAAIADEITNIAKKYSLDAVIVIYYERRNQHNSVPILPLFLNKDLLGEVSWKISCYIDIIDGASMERIGRDSLFVYKGDNIDNSYWPPYTDNGEKLKFLENMFKNALKEDLTSRLQKMGFIENIKQ